LGLQAAAAAAAAGQPTAAGAAAVKRPLSGEEVAAFGFKFVQQPEHTMFGVLVDQQVGGCRGSSSRHGAAAMSVCCSPALHAHRRHACAYHHTGLAGSTPRECVPPVGKS
jgi:hypothetical protein